MAKRSQSLSKTITYMRRKVRVKSWEIGYKTDPISQICSSLDVSYPVVKNAVRILNKQGILEDRGRDGIIVVGRPSIRLSTALSTLDDITKIRRNLKAAKMISNGGIFNGRTVTIINRIKDMINIFFPITGKELTFNVSIVKETMYSPVTVQDIIENNDLIPIYSKQSDVKDYLYLILPNLKMLNISRSK